MTSIPHLLFIPTLGTVLAITTFCLQHNHLLSALLSLEAITLNLFTLLLGSSFFFNFESHSCLILLTLGACEASLGLAILVSLIRMHGNDYVSSFTAQKC
uniref:NADH-ubiquinone oxidoreductase chain 4L n=1 Tax=Pseudorimula sp. RSIO35641 TaxID=2652779 RepID=A0A5J6VBC6_9VEST|nr:NADH dehydrogenase subunit 4L [Pseudorimula sp. RSIO35641]